jgi:hypothetical protein
MRRIAFRIFTTLLAAATLALAGPAVASAGQPFSFSQRGISADAAWEECTENTPRRGTTTCTFTFLFAFQGTERATGEGAFKGTRVCLFVETFTFGGPGRGRSGGGGDSYSFESGCTTAPEGTLSVARDLSSAALAPTTITLDTYECIFDPETGEETCTVVSSREVTVSATWTAISGLVRSSERFTFRVEGCRETFSSRTKSRDAEAVGTLDGSSLGTSIFASVSEGTFTFRSTCGF